MAGVSSADHFLIVNDSSSTSCDAIEASLTALGHTFTREAATSAVLLTPTEVRTDYNATFWMGNPTVSGPEPPWCIALMSDGGNLMVADNDFGYYNQGQVIYTTYFESTYVSDSGSDGTLTGQDFMAGIDPDISADPYPDDFTITGANGVIIFDAPSGNVAGTAIERTPVTEQYRAIYLAWDYVNTPSATRDTDAITTEIVTYLSEPVIPVELMSFIVE